MDTNTFDTGGLSAEELELLAYMLEEEGVEIAENQTIFPREQQSELPLSFAQSRLWFLDQLDPEMTAYNVAFAVRISGRLDRVALERSLNEVIARHEVLRTTFAPGTAATNGQPIQQIAPALRIELPLLDLQHLPPAEHEAEIYRQATQVAQHRFDLQRGPLIVGKLLQLPSDGSSAEYVLLLTIHHIVFDGWSISIFLREVMAFYDTLAGAAAEPHTSAAAALPPLPLQYADFALWQRQWLAQDAPGSALAEQLAYWKRQLGGRNGRSGPPTLELPTDRPRPPRQSHQGAHCYRALPEALAAALAELSQREGATLFMTLLAAFDILLYRYSGQDDIVVGTPIAGRDFVEIERLIGFFVNTLVLRSDLSGNPSFRQLLARLRETTLEAYAHQNIPFERLAEQLQPERDLSRSPLFQVMFVLQNAPMPDYQRDDLQMSFLQIESGAAMFDLMLALNQTPTGLNAVLEYATDLFDADTMERLLDHYQVLLEQIVARPDAPIATLDLLTAAERQRLLHDWNASAADYPRDLCVHQLFEAQAARTPHASAVVFQDQSLSYAQLNARANQLAHHLRQRGVGPDTLVALCVERSLDMLVGILGVLKAGGAYVPLDPTYPAARLQFMLRDARTSLLLTRQSLAAMLTADGMGRSLSVIALDADWPTIAQQPTENLPSLATPAHLAYVIYTSGSVGQPKGVLVPHGALTNYTVAASQHFAISADDRVLQFASISFDTAAEEIYPCLTCGATLVLRTDELLSSAPGFLAACQQFGLTVLDLPTAYWQQLTVEIAAQQLALPDSLRLMIIGGEQALPDRVALWQQTVGGGVRLMNSYGPTEATIVATLWELPADTAELHTVPIGRPIVNTQAYVLDRQLNPVPVGVPGELYLGGAGLARGYLAQPALTASTFIADSFSNQPGARLYRTGDLVRYLPDGTLEFLGRADQQVKIRGFRVEPGEIEAVLQRHPAIRELAVVAREAAPGDTRLVAYVVPATAADEQTADAELAFGVELRRWGLERLPDYMIPTALVLLPALPISPSGKIDRQALPAPDWSRRPLDKTFVAPRTPIEQTVADLAAQVLHLERVGIHDNFFALGGHSLVATQLVARLSQTFAIELPLRTLFEMPTVAGLAEHVEALQWAAQETLVPFDTLDHHLEGEL